MMELERLRGEIDLLDKEIAELLTKRMNVSLKVADYKKEQNLPVLNSSREKQVLDGVAALTQERYAEGMKRIYREIMAVSRDLQK